MATNDKNKANKRETPSLYVMPNSLESEQMLLSCIMRDQTNQLEIVSQLDEHDFYHPSHQIIFGACHELVKLNVTVNFASIIDALKRNGKLVIVGDMDYIIKLHDMAPGTSIYNDFLKIVKRCSVMRQLLSACEEISKKARSDQESEEVLAFAEEQIFNIHQGDQQSSLKDLAQTSTEALIKITKKYQDPDYFAGTKTGFWKLDEMTNGLHGGELIVLGARPGIGKSALAMNIAENVASSGKKVAIFSLEMSNEQLMERMLSSMSFVKLKDIKSGKLSRGETDIASLSKANEVVNSAMHLYGNDKSNIKVAEIRSQCRRLKIQHGLDLVIIDYIGLMEGDRHGENRQAEVASISRGLKVMAKELNVPIIALSQVKRDVDTRNIKTGGEKNTTITPPVLSDLRESGAIEQDADIVLFIHRDREEKAEVQKCELIVAKHRNGETGNIPVFWYSQYVKYMDERMVKNLQQSMQLSRVTESNEQPQPDYGVDSNAEFEVEMTENINKEEITEE